MRAETIIGLIVLVTFGLAFGVFFSVYSPGKSPSKPPAVEPRSVEAPEGVIQATNYTVLVSMGQNICEGCHLSGKKYVPQAYEVKQHVEGGAYCLICHTIDHNTHPMSPKNRNVTCERCHGKKGEIPAFQNGTIACAECHDFPDPLNPSNGNLIVIHRPRNVDCAACHIGSSGSCLKCHSEIKNDTKWKKRLTHFDTILKTVK